LPEIILGTFSTVSAELATFCPDAGTTIYRSKKGKAGTALSSQLVKSPEWVLLENHSVKLGH
jgi:hypothetical protein